MNLAGNKTLLGALGAAVVAGGAWLAFGFFGIQAAFIDTEVSEEGPAFASGALAAEDQAAIDDAMAEAEPVTVDEGMMPGEIVTLFSGEFSGNSQYSIEGDALVLNDGTEQRFLRFENFESSNGPDLNVYLRAGDGTFRDLGDLKGNIGDQNYEIPTDVDLGVYDTVEIWCVRFGVGFGQAPLSAA
ncbi:MAG: DM13 domain-containing protein [Acidimicrobiales bacterium]